MIENYLLCSIAVGPVLGLFAELEHVYSGGAGCDLLRGRGALGGLRCPTSAVLYSSAGQRPQPLLRGQL